MQEGVLDLDQLAERAGADRVVGELGAREVGHLARAAGEDAGARSSAATIRRAGAEVDPERLLAQEVLAGRDRLEVELLVQVVRDGEVEDVEVGVLEQRAAVVGEQPHALDALEPGERRPGSCRTRPRAAACTGWSSSAAQRPIAAASSRPIRPPPTIPMRATLTRRRGERLRRASRPRARPTSAPASSPPGCRAGSRCGRRRCPAAPCSSTACVRSRISWSVTRPPPRRSSGTRATCDDAVVVGEVVGRVGLDDVGAELDRLADEAADAVDVAAGLVAASPAGLERERLDHQRHRRRGRTRRAGG